MAETPTPQAAPAADENQLIAERREKLKALREAQKQGKGVAFPNDFKPDSHAAQLHAAHGTKDAEQLQDGTGRIQVYVTRDAIGEDAYAAFKHWDLGDIVAAEGTLFKTRTGELSIQ